MRNSDYFFPFLADCVGPAPTAAAVGQILGVLLPAIVLFSGLKAAVFNTHVYNIPNRNHYEKKSSVALKFF